MAEVGPHSPRGTNLLHLGNVLFFSLIFVLHSPVGGRLLLSHKVTLIVCNRPVPSVRNLPLFSPEYYNYPKQSNTDCIYGYTFHEG